MDPPQRLRINSETMTRAETNHRIGQHQVGRGDSPVFHNHIAGVGFQPGHEPDFLAVEAIKPGIVDLGPIDDQQIARLKLHLFGGKEIVGVAVREDDAVG